MNNFCGKCKAEIKAGTDNFNLKTLEGVKCTSLCGRIFHSNCTDLPAECLKLLINTPNLLWQCNSCVVMTSDAQNKIDLLSRQMREVQSKCIQLEQFISEVKSSNLQVHNKNLTKPNAQTSTSITTPKTLLPANAAQLHTSSPTASEDNACENFVDAIDIPNIETESREQDWVTVRRKETKKKQKHNTNIRKKPKRVVGIAPVSDAFEVVHTMKYLHISKFNVSTEPVAVLKFVAEGLGVQPNIFKCTKLTKRDADLSKLSFVNFKLGVPSPLYEKVYNKTMWPMSIKIKPFINKSKNLEKGVVTVPPPQVLTPSMPTTATTATATAEDINTLTSTATTSNILRLSVLRETHQQ